MTPPGIMNSESTMHVLVVVGVLMVCGLLFLSGCGGRVAMPVAESNSLDPQLSCAHIRSEYAVNIKKIEDITGERIDKADDNIGLLLLLDPLWLDFSGAEKKEVEALIARNKRLLKLGEEKSCKPITLATEPDEPTDRPEQ